MIDFAGFEMPVSYDQYSGGMRKEHLIVREDAGIFDVSHMGQFFVEGPDATRFLCRVATRNFEAAKEGQAIYALLLNEKGGCIDDIIAYKVSTESYLVIVNASNIEKDFKHLSSLAQSFEVSVRNESDHWALIALQGPKAAERLTQLISQTQNAELAEKAFSLGYYRFTQLSAGLWVARTGYTGEDGFELMIPASEAARYWQSLIELKCFPIGLGARDTLRLEVGFPLYGQELSEDRPAHESLASFAIRSPHDFIGKTALEAPTRRLTIALVADNPKPMRAHEAVYRGDQRLGEVTSGSFSPILKKGMGLAEIEVSALAQAPREGDIFLLESGGKRREARVETLPLVETTRVKKKS